MELRSTKTSFNKQPNNSRNSKFKSISFLFDEFDRSIRSSFSDEVIQKIALEKTKLLAKRLDREDEKTTIVVHNDEPKEDRWDCETILTTYSNIYNHPKLIVLPPKNKIRLSAKTGLPLDEHRSKFSKASKEESSSEDENVEQEENDSNGETSKVHQVCFERKKGETSEERRARKQLVKEFRRVRFQIDSFFSFR